MAKRTSGKRKSDPIKVRAVALQGLKRSLKVLGGCAAACALMTLVAFGSKAMRHWFSTSPTFSVEAVDIEGLVNASKEEILALSEVKEGENIFDVDVDAVAQSVRKNPWVEDVEVRRLLPRKISIHIVEHVPAALVEMDSLYYANLEGRAFKRVEGGDSVDLPILRGITRETYNTKQQESEEAIRQGISVAALYEASGLNALHPLSDVEIDPVEGLTLRCGEGAMAVRMGSGDFQLKFSRLKQIYGELEKRRAAALVIRMDNRTRPEWVAVQLDRSSLNAFE